MNILRPRLAKGERRIARPPRRRFVDAECEMLAVEAGLGWYMTWSKAWFLFNNMFAALILICLIFTAVTKILNIIKARVLRWQIGVTK